MNFTNPNMPRSVSTLSPEEYAIGDSSVFCNLLRSLSRKILEEKDLTQILRALCEESSQVLGADSAFVSRYLNNSGDKVIREVLYAHNAPAEVVKIVETNKTPNSATEKLSQGEFQFISDLAPIVEPIPTTRESETLAVCVIPLIVGGECYAGLTLVFKTPRKFDNHDRQLAMMLGDLASLAIEKARRLGEVEQRAERLEVVNRIVQSINSASKPDDLFRSIVHEIRDAIQCERCTISSLDTENKRITYWYTESDVEVSSQDENRGLDDGCDETELYDNTQLIYVSDLERDKKFKCHRFKKAGFRSLLIIPIVLDGRCGAHLTLCSVRENAYTPDDIKLLMPIYCGKCRRKRHVYLF